MLILYNYTLQDTQEFLRCFMDQLHEELKDPLLAEMTEEDEDHTYVKEGLEVIAAVSLDI